MLTPPLLTTKLHPPTTRRGHIARARLLDRLDACLQPQQRLCIVACPAGYGKTALLSEWVDRLRQTQPARSVAWVSLDEGDDDVVRFWTVVVASLRAACALPDLGAEALSLFRAPGPPALDAIVALLSNDLTACAVPILLVLDDYHLIQAPAVHGSLAALIESLAPTVQVFIATRAEPPLGLARLRVRGALSELGPGDLRFTPGETAAFLNAWLGHVPASDAAQLETRTEGWAAGLQLAALALQTMPGAADRSAFVRDFTGSQRHIVDYLVEDVLHRQTSEVQEFLLRTSILRRLSAPVCAALFDDPDGSARAARLLEQLERANLFLMVLDSDRRWFRYHPLFAEALQTRLVATEPTLVAEHHRRASIWFAEAGLPELAIHHALAAQDYPRAADLIRAQARPQMIRGELTTLIAWIESLPRAVRDGHAWLMLEHAMALLFSGRLGEAEARATQAEALAATQPDADHLAGIAASLRAYAADARGAFGEALVQAERADALLPADDFLPRGILPFVRGRAYLAADDLAAAERAFADMIVVGQRAGNIWTLSVAVGQVAYARRLRGQLQAAATAFSEALQLAESRGERAFAPAAMLEAGLAGILYEHDQLDEAQSLLDGALVRLRGWGNPASLTAALITLSRLHVTRGRRKEAEQALREAEQVMRRTAVSPATRSALAAEQIYQWLRSGQLYEAARWADGVTQTRLSSAVADDILAVAGARVRHAQGRSDEAVRTLTAVADRAEAGGRVGFLIEALLLKSLALTGARQSLAALDALARALQLADPEGFLRTFLDEGEPLRRLLVDLDKQAGRHPLAAGSGVRRLLAAFSAAGPAAPIGLVEPLSARELEVLRLVQDGRSNVEIAERLVVSLATVKKHLEHTHAKLGVHSRTSALARARELGLL